VSSPVGDLESWWEGLRAASLVGTARRQVPRLPDLGVASREGASREEALLEGAALGDAVRRAGAVPARSGVLDDPAPAETRAVASSPAVQILELLLTQGPVSAAARDLLVRHWLESATAAGRVVPPRLLPAVLDLGTTRTDAVRRAVAAVAGERGAWLAARNPAWHWLATPDPAAGGSAGRATALLALRRTDPAAGRAQIEETWETDGAQARAAALATLAEGLGPDDESFLEHCLDDRARVVREEAARLLDRLPGSARAARMADRLRPLLAVKGTVRKHLQVGLPDDPDVAGVRDGLVEPPKNTSRRTFWLRQVVTGAPLSVWTDAVGGDPRKALSMLTADDALTLLGPLSDAAAAQGDLDWARALLDATHDSRLAALLPPGERDDRLAARLSRETLAKTAHELQQSPRPWGPRLSERVITAIGREKDAGHAVRILRDTLPVALHPDTMPKVERLMRSAGGDDAYLRNTLRDVLQYQSLHRSISEAFR
jgi:hypothetical protein